VATDFDLAPLPVERPPTPPRHLGVSAIALVSLLRPPFPVHAGMTRWSSAADDHRSGPYGAGSTKWPPLPPDPAITISRQLHTNRLLPVRTTSPLPLALTWIRCSVDQP
jgi:hypothetical protein